MGCRLALCLQMPKEPALMQGPSGSMWDRERGLSSIRASGGPLLVGSSIQLCRCFCEDKWRCEQAEATTLSLPVV